MGMSRRWADAQIGTALIGGRKAFQHPMAEGVKLLNAIQDVYLCEDVTMAQGFAINVRNCLIFCKNRQIACYRPLRAATNY
jgi:hypothetical protein